MQLSKSADVRTPHWYKEMNNESIQEILSPYWTPFVQNATLVQTDEYIGLNSRLGVAKPWYCDSTGHLNAVELNLAFNQMMYITIGEAITAELITELSDYDRRIFLKKYWPDFLITKVESEFKAPLHVDAFSAALRITKIKRSRQHLWFQLDLTAAPGHQDWPEPGLNSHAYAKMTLVIKDYLDNI